LECKLPQCVTLRNSTVCQRGTLATSDEISDTYIRVLLIALSTWSRSCLVPRSRSMCTSSRDQICKIVCQYGNIFSQFGRTFTVPSSHYHRLSHRQFQFTNFLLLLSSNRCVF